MARELCFFAKFRVCALKCVCACVWCAQLTSPCASSRTNRGILGLAEVIKDRKILDALVSLLDLPEPSAMLSFAVRKCTWRRNRRKKYVSWGAYVLPLDVCAYDATRRAMCCVCGGCRVDMYRNKKGIIDARCTVTSSDGFLHASACFFNFSRQVNRAWPNAGDGVAGLVELEECRSTVRRTVIFMLTVHLSKKRGFLGIVHCQQSCSFVRSCCTQPLSKTPPDLGPVALAGGTQAAAFGGAYALASLRARHNARQSTRVGAQEHRCDGLLML